MACNECRRRRISCDNVKPKCHHCSRLSKSCVYTVSNSRKPAPRKSVKELETRLAKLEAQLQASPAPSNPLETEYSPNHGSRSSSNASQDHTIPVIVDREVNQPADFDALETPGSSYLSIGATQSQYVVDGLPDVATIKELNWTYFNMIHPNMPILSPTRMSDTCMLSNRASPLCLQYVMWAHAAAANPKYANQAQQFYSNSRMHLEYAEMEGEGSEPISVAHAQTWCLIAAYQVEHLSPKQAYMSNSRAVALCQIFELGTMDSSNRHVAHTNSPENYVEAEEWRRTFWYIVYSNQWATSGRVGRPGGMLNENITTLLPCSEDAFTAGDALLGPHISAAISKEPSQDASPMVLAIISGHLLEKICKHNQTMNHAEVGFISDELWQKHKRLRDELNATIRNIPLLLQPTNTLDPLALHVSISLYSFSISLDQYSLDFMNEKGQGNIIKQIRDRQRYAANAIPRIADIAMQRGLGINRMYPFASGMFYLASIVFVNDLKEDPEDVHAHVVLKFIMQVLRSYTRRMQSAQTFLSQLSGNLLENNISIPIDDTDIITNMYWNGLEDDFKFCGPLFHGPSPSKGLYTQ